MSETADKETVIPGEIVMRKVKIEFAEDEKAHMGEKIANALKELDSIEEEKKSAVAEFAAEIKAKKAEISILKDNINLGYEYQNVDCELKKNFDSGYREYWLDGKIVDEEPIRPIDHQLTIVGEEPDVIDVDEEKEEESDENDVTDVDYEEPEKDKDEDQGEEPPPVKLTKQQKARFRELTDAANLATKERRYDDAVNLYNDALAINPFDKKAIEKKTKLIPYITAE